MNQIKTMGISIFSILRLLFLRIPNLEDNEIKFREKGNSITYPYIYHLNYNKEVKKALIKTGLNKLFKKTEDFYKLQQKVHGLANKRMLEAIRS